MRWKQISGLLVLGLTFGACATHLRTTVWTPQPRGWEGYEVESRLDLWLHEYEPGKEAVVSYLRKGVEVGRGHGMHVFESGVAAGRAEDVVRDIVADDSEAVEEIDKRVAQMASATVSYWRAEKRIFVKEGTDVRVEPTQEAAVITRTTAAVSAIRYAPPGTGAKEAEGFVAVVVAPPELSRYGHFHWVTYGGTPYYGFMHVGFVREVALLSDEKEVELAADGLRHRISMGLRDDVGYVKLIRGRTVTEGRECLNGATLLVLLRGEDQKVLWSAEKPIGRMLRGIEAEWAATSSYFLDPKRGAPKALFPDVEVRLAKCE